MRADLHFHSKYSDGSLWPNELAEMAINKGLEIVALTDHDTFDGVNDFLVATEKLDIIGIPAIEINFVDTVFGFNSELLAYFPKGKFENTFNFLSYYQGLRRKVAEQAIVKARCLFNTPNLNIDELIELKIGSNQLKFLHNKISLTRRDVYTYLCDKNVSHGFSNFQEFKNYFFNTPEFIELSVYPELGKCIESVKSDGGYSVIAHPAYQFNKDVKKIREEEDKYKENLIKAKQIGLWGIEMHSYDSISEASVLNEIFYEFANECKLNVTFGSDFHSKNLKTWREMDCLNGEFYGFK